MPGKTEIKRITAAQTWPVRHQVMWPDQSLEFVQLPDDAVGVHFGTFKDEQLVSVISLFQEDNRVQFRKFATLPSFQGRGLGRKLLKHVFAYARTQNDTTIWCHARTSALGFYLRAGMQVQGETFEKNGVEYVQMEKNLFLKKQP
ncbi:GNAT family N-acetyltransferase [Rufibacter sp. XAAS-G3-1]|uniref:GNAT family N-acetyltransferase n=1 Tax=Rufibacter sp. XAAS-G3-1 TaxID=2729134 RepID=UPI0015E776DA|nr:GNAT family N-acetyltransferase [Rufibacter sp. XAAS-G3-1]